MEASDVYTFIVIFIISVIVVWQFYKLTIYIKTWATKKLKQWVIEIFEENAKTLMALILFSKNNKEEIEEILEFVGQKAIDCLNEIEKNHKGLIDIFETTFKQ